MNDRQTKWNPPGWPWELELITLLFFLAAMLVPFYLVHDTTVVQSTRELQQAASNSGISVGRETLSTQIGFLMSVVVVALYILHWAFAAVETNRVTASPLHLFSPCVFAVIAYHRILDTPGQQNSAFSFIDGSILQVVILVAGVGILTSILSWIRRFRYMITFEDVQWDVVSPAAYDASYLGLLIHWRPLLYPPRRYLACPEGIVIEGWFYAMPIGYADVHSMTRLSGTGMLNTGQYFASSTRSLIRIELHDSIKPLYISPQQHQDFIKYCAQFIARRKASGKSPATRHGMLRAAETSHGTTAAGLDNQASPPAPPSP